jgi:hypothetical protein
VVPIDLMATEAAFGTVTPLPTPTLVTALSPVAAPDPATQNVNDMTIGSPEWYASISMSPTLELVWSGASDAVNIASSADVAAVAVERQHAFVAVSQNEAQGALLVFDISNPAAPIQRAYLPLPDYAGYGEISLVGGYALIATGQAVRIVDLRDVDHPAMHGSVETPGWITGVSVAADRVYVTTQGDDGDVLSIFAINDSADLTRLGSVTIPQGNRQDPVVVDTLAYIPTFSGLEIVNVSDPAASKHIGSYEFGPELAQAILGSEYKDVSLTAESVQVSGQRAYLGTNVGLLILDVSNPTKPTFLGSYAHPGPYSISDIEIAADRAYMTFANWGSSDFGGMDILDISDPAHPKRVGGYGTVASNAYDVQVDDQLIYVANGRRGLLIFRLPS